MDTKPKSKSKRTVAEWEAELRKVQDERERYWLATVDLVRGADNARAGQRIKLTARASAADGAGRIDATILRPLGAHGGILILHYHDGGHVEAVNAEEWSRPVGYDPLYMADLRQRVRAALNSAWDAARGVA